MTVNDSTKYLAKDCQKIEMKVLLREIKKVLKLQLLKTSLTINGVETDIIASQTGNGGQRYWFTCSLCKNRCGILYRSQINGELIACRSCLQLKYRNITC